MTTPGESPTKWQAQAFRFGVRRLESAVASGDPLLRSDPVRRRLNIALIISFVLAILICGGFAVYGFVKPEPTIGAAEVVINEDTGGAYVSRDGRLYPAMNLASALLAAGRGASGDKAPSSTTVGSDAIGSEARGPMLGIPGAPNVLPSGSKLIDPLWTVCDRTTDNTALPPGSKPVVRTTAILGRAAPLLGSIGTTRAMLVTPDGGTTTYLLWQGKRSKIDPNDPTIKIALQLGAQDTPRPISASLLNIIPQSPDIVVPTIDQSAQPEYATGLGVTVGEVFGLDRADRTRDVYVALPDGYQPISRLLADLIRIRLSQKAELPLVKPAALDAAPLTKNPLAVADYPATRPDIVGYKSAAVACVARRGTDPATARIYSLAAVPLPTDAKPVSVTKPSALTVDTVYIAPGRGAVFSSTTQPEKTGTRALYLITDDGVAYPVVSTHALTSLGYGLGDVAPTAPALLGLLPQGPALDPDTAAHFYPQTGISASSLPSPSGQSTSG